MLAVALAVAACQAGFSIYFTTLDDLVRRLRVAEATGRFNRQLQAYLRPSVLIVDLCRHRDYAEKAAGVGSLRRGRGVGFSA
jgi:DNA replication protein DnaC